MRADPSMKCQQLSMGIYGLWVSVDNSEESFISSLVYHRHPHPAAVAALDVLQWLGQKRVQTSIISS